MTSPRILFVTCVILLLCASTPAQPAAQGQRGGRGGGGAGAAGDQGGNIAFRAARDATHVRTIGALPPGLTELVLTLPPTPTQP